MEDSEQMKNIGVRLARPDDAPALLGIYAPYVTGTSVSFEYDAPTEEDFSKRIATIGSAFPWLVCEADGKAAGYVYASRFAQRAAYRWGAEMSIYLSPDYHRMGLASALYPCEEALLAAQGYRKLYARITMPNPQSFGLHEHLGFTRTAVYPNAGYKFGMWRDVSVLEKQILPLCADPPAPLPITELSPAFISGEMKKAEEAIRARNCVFCRSPA